MSDWIDALRKACKTDSQAAVGRRIGYSPTVVNQVLRGGYPGDLSRVETAVRGALLNATVPCPVVGELRLDICLEHQGRPFAATNPTRVALYQTCPTCPHRQRRGKKEDVA